MLVEEHLGRLRLRRTDVHGMRHLSKLTATRRPWARRVGSGVPTNVCSLRLHHTCFPSLSILPRWAFNTPLRWKGDSIRVRLGRPSGFEPDAFPFSDGVPFGSRRRPFRSVRVARALRPCAFCVLFALRISIGDGRRGEEDGV